VAVSLSVVIPTLGRPSLERTLRSCADADEIVVVLDTARGATELPCALPSNAVYVEGCWGITGGHGGRQAGIQRATGTHLAFFDDDDVYAPGAISLMRDAACDRPVIFRMDHYAHGILWRDREVRFGNVSTQMYVVPNDPARLGTWEPHVPGIPEPGGDYTFIAGCVERMGEPVWREEVIAVLRPTAERVSRYRALTIVTPWYEHPELAADYVEAVEDELADADEVIVIDNGGAPSLPIQFRVIDVGENLGFAEGSNAGLRRAQNDAVLFLNNDIRLGSRGWLEAVRASLEPGVLCGPLRDDHHASVDGEQMPYIDGWCLAGIRDDLLDLGGFDAWLEEPAYYSDNLLCLEARAAGMTLRDVRVGLVHKLNATAGAGSTSTVRAAAAPNRDRYLARARELLVAV
jgi:glycosyltransferase involved in cell wall biosynthesis